MALHQEEWQFVEQWPFAEAVLDATMDDAVLQMMSTRIQSVARGRAARKAATQMCARTEPPTPARVGTR